MRARLSRVRVVLLLGVLVLALQPASAQAADPPYAQLSCAYGVVQTSAPMVTAQQVQHTTLRPDAIWWAKLWVYAGGSWRPVGLSSPWTSRILSDSGYQLGTGYGYAGPTWYPQYGGAGTQALYWNVTPGYWYAIQNWVNDGSWSTAWASTGSSYACRA